MPTPLGPALWQAIVQRLPHAIVLLDGGLRVVLANRAAAALFRIPPDRLTGMAITALVPHAELAPWLREFAATSAKSLEVTFAARSRPRAPLTLQITAVPLAIAARRRVTASRRVHEYRLLQLEDITDKAALETQLVETEKQAAMGQLAAGVLHEVRNPVTSLGSNLQFVRNTLTGVTNSDVLQALDVSLDHLEQMRQLLGTLSGFPRRPALRFERADLHDMVGQCVRFIAKEAERRGIQVTVAFGPFALLCEMDVRVIKQVLLNLLTNAMDAMPNGGRLEVRTSYRRPTRQMDAAAVVDVADTGVGISDSDLRRVFRPLFSTKPHGAGLGLSFCRQAVEEHGGEIRLSSAGKDRGTLASVLLPVYHAGEE